MSRQKLGAHYYPLRPREMAATCRRLAADLRREAAEGTLPRVHLTASSGGIDNTISRAEAARRLDEQAERWEREPNVIDRARSDDPWARPQPVSAMLRRSFGHAYVTPGTTSRGGAESEGIAANGERNSRASRLPLNYLSPGAEGPGVVRIGSRSE